VSEPNETRGQAQRAPDGDARDTHGRDAHATQGRDALATRGQNESPVPGPGSPVQGPLAARSARTLSGRGLAILAGVMLVLTGLVGLGCTLVGPVELTTGIWWFRASGAIVAAIVGAGLASSGMALQGLLRNPLADPYILGISSGAGVGYLAGETLARWFHMPGLAATALPTLAGALLTCLVVYLLAQRRGKLDPYVLLLSGVIVNVLNGALILSMLIFVHESGLVRYVGWGIGQIREGVLEGEPALLGACATAVVGGWFVIFLRGSAMNVMGMGDEVASSSGVGVHALRIEVFLIVSLMTAAAVALAGPVGFVGLIIPHVCRLVSGPDHRKLAVLSGFVGAMFLMAADTFCRTAGAWVGKGLIPLGVVTAIVGGPLFIFLLRRHGREGRR
jgi:iron complex transport system permease protein